MIKEEKWIDGSYYKTEWSYDSMDRITSMTYPDGEVLTYTYNDQLLLAGMSGTNNYISGTSYNALDKPTQIILGNGRITDLKYCWLEQPAKVPFGALGWMKTYKSGLPDLQELDYTLDNVGNITQINDIRNGEVINFGYDDLNRLTSAGAPINGSYTLNQIGNLLSKTEGGVTYNFDYSTTTHKHAPNSVNGVPYTYDANGNVINRSGVDFKYDAENHLIKISQGAAYVIRMGYDGDGKRSKRVDNNGTIHYAGPHYERNVGTGADTTEVVTKLYWVQLGSYRRLVAFRRGGVLYFVHSDHLGGTNILSDVTGNEVGALRYYAFGQTRVQTGLVPTDKLYTGQTLDQSSGLYYYGARYYDAGLARFIQADPVVPDYRNPQTLNRYSYTINNPLKYTDPSGLDLMIVPGVGGEKDWEDPIAWKDWIMRYSGWTEAQWGQFHGAWTAEGADRLAVMQQYGVHIFNWQAVPRGSWFGSTDVAAQELNRQMSGMEDITVIAHSKGGAVAEEFMAQAARGTRPANPRKIFYGARIYNPVDVQRFVLIDPAINPLWELAGTPLGLRPNVISASDMGGDITTINNWVDPVGGQVSGGRNYQELVLEPFSFPHAYSQGIHGLKTYRALTVFGPLGASGW